MMESLPDKATPTAAAVAALGEVLACLTNLGTIRAEQITEWQAVHEAAEGALRLVAAIAEHGAVTGPTDRCGCRTDAEHDTISAAMAPGGHYDKVTEAERAATIVGDRFAEALVAAAEERGYARAVANLRDDERYREWWLGHERDDPAPYWLGAQRPQLADYLEAVGPSRPEEHDEPDPAPPASGLDAGGSGWDPTSPQWAVIRAAIAWRNSIAQNGDRHAYDVAEDVIQAADALVAAVDELPHIGDTQEAS